MLSLFFLGFRRAGLAGRLQRAEAWVCVVVGAGADGGCRAGCCGDGVAWIVRCFCCVVSGV